MADHLPTVWFASPGDPDTLTGGYIYNARVVSGLRSSGWEVRSVRLPDTYPFPAVSDQTTAKNLLFAAEPHDILVVDGLAFGAFSDDVLANLRCKVVALVHHPLADEAGLTDAQMIALFESEKNALRYVSGVIVTSPHTADALVDRFDVSRDSICVAIPGVDRPEFEAVTSNPPVLLSVGSLTARKGHDLLVEALSEIQDLSWQAIVVGSVERDPNVAKDVRARISRHALGARVTLAGELTQEALSTVYKGASMFVLATRHEGYGMVFSEAMVHGLPIVSCAAGAVPDTVPDTAGLLVPPEDVAAFADAMRALLTDHVALDRLSAGSRAAGDRLPTWRDTALRFGEKLHEVTNL